MGFLVDLDDLHLDRFTNGQDLGGVVDPAPCHVSDVQQPVNAAQINERTVFGDVLDHAVNFLTFGQIADDFGALFGTAFFKDRTAGHNDIATATVHFQDLERLLETHQWACVADRAHIHLATGQEGNGAAKVHGEATFDAAKDRAIDTLFVGIGFFQTIPCFFTARHLAADNSFAAGVFDLTQEHFNRVTDGQFSLFTGICEFFNINAAFHFIADVDDGLARFDRDNLAFDN